MIPAIRGKGQQRITFCTPCNGLSEMLVLMIPSFSITLDMAVKQRTLMETKRTDLTKSSTPKTMKRKDI